MSDDWGKRATALEVGATYCVQRHVASPPGRSAFQRGETVRLSQVAYSRYDNMHVYTFEAHDSGLKSFWLGDEESISQLDATFKRC